MKNTSKNTCPCEFIGPTMPSWNEYCEFVTENPYADINEVWGTKPGLAQIAAVARKNGNQAELDRLMGICMQQMGRDPDAQNKCNQAIYGIQPPTGQPDQTPHPYVQPGYNQLS